MSTSVFRSLDEGNGPARALMEGGVGWLVDKINALSGLPELDRPERAARPRRDRGTVRGPRQETGTPGWPARRRISPLSEHAPGSLRMPRPISLSRAGHPRPRVRYRACSCLRGCSQLIWSTRLYSSAGFADQLPLPSEIQAVILDGAGAIKYLDDVEAPVVVCIIDRSIADETAAEFIVQRRNAGSDPVAVASLGWSSVPGIEALAFKVPL